MNNNDIFKKLRVALQLRDDQIVEILQLVDFRISKAELGAFFRSEDHPNYMDCGDQILRNFLNGLIIHLRGTKENPKVPKQVLEAIKKDKKPLDKEFTPKPKTQDLKPNTRHPKPNHSKPKTQDQKSKSPIENIRFKNGKKNKE